MAMNEVAEELVDNRLCKNQAIEVSLGVYHPSTWWSDISLSIQDVPLEMVMDLVSAPFHQRYDCKWTMQVQSWGEVVLSTEIKKNNKTIEVNIHVHEGSFRACEIIKVPIRAYTEEEKARKLLEASEGYEYTYVMDCKG